MNAFKDHLVKFYAYLCVFIVIAVIFWIFYFIFANGISQINLDFLTKNPQGLNLGESGGIKDAIIGSFLLMILSMIFSALLGVSCAIYRQIYCTSSTIKLGLKFIIQTMASIPSILLGMFVYGLFIVSLDIPKSLLTASITLALMVFPFVEVSVEKVISQIDEKMLRDSFALGVDKNFMARKLVLPTIRKNIISILILAGSYAIGATAPLLLTGVVFMAKAEGLLSPVMALPFHLHMLLSQSVATQNAYATALVLIFILIILHLLSAIVLFDIGEKIARYFKHKRS